MSLKTEIKQTLRAQANRPRLAAAAILTLALGIGATTAVFTLTNAVMIRSLPYRDGGRLVILQESSREGVYPPSYATFLDWKKASRSFEQVACSRTGTCLVLRDYADRFPCKWVSSDFFSTLGVRFVQGRAFTSDEDSSGGRPVAIVTESFYAQQFGRAGGRAIQSVNVEGTTREIVGVIPADFRLSGDAQLFFPIQPQAADEPRGQRDALLVIGRLRPGTSIEHASSEMKVIARRLENQYPQEMAGFTVAVVSFADWVAGNTRTVVWIFFAVAGLVLLIACANAATLLLARLNERRHEFAVRSAIGAERRDLMRQTLVESLVLALEASVLGFLLADTVLSALRPFVPAEIAPLVKMDHSVVLFTLVISGLTALLFGLFPALRFSTFDLSRALKDGERSVEQPGRHRFRRGLAVAEVAMAMMLVVSAGLMLRTAYQLTVTDPGFETRGLVGMGFQGATIRLYREAMTPGGMDFGKYAKGLESYNKELLRRIRALPGIENAASVYPLPMSGTVSTHAYLAEGQPDPGAGHYPYASLYSVSPGYFSTMKIPLFQGRVFTDADRWGAPGAVIINRSFAGACWPGANPIGRRIRLPLSFGPESFSVVGVVADSKHSGPSDQSFQQIYMSCYSFPATGMLAVRTRLQTPELVSVLRAEIARYDREAAIYDVKPMGELVSGSFAYQSRMTQLMTIFASVALLLAAAGVFGIMSQGVSQRRHEIGIRIALGASSGRVFGLVLKEAGLLTALGIVIGVAGSVALTRVLTVWLFGVTATDPTTFAASALLLALTGLFAAYWPARRAASLDPIRSLRCD